MPFNRPSLSDLIKRAEGDIKGPLDVIMVLRRSFIGVVARVLAGLAHILYGFLQFIERQAFPDTAEGEYLERWAAIWKVIRKVATFAQFTVDVTGIDGTVISAGTFYQRDDGTEYTTDDEQTIAGGVATLNLTATPDFPGSIGNLEIGDSISVQSPIAGLDSEGVVAAITIEAEDTETDESLQERLIDKIQNPPSGGAPNDYIQWAEAVPGVTRAWVLPQNLGPGTVGVSFVEDGDVPITPDGAKIAEVEAYINDPFRRPVTANLNVFAPVLLPVDMSISLKPNTVAVQNDVIAELEDLFLRDSALAGAYKSAIELHTGTILLSKINEAISTTVGEDDHEITLINGGAPANVAPATNELAVLGVITWATLP